MAVRDAYVKAIDRWHAERIRRLTSPDGWLSLTGLEWLQPGVNRIGSGEGNDIVLAKAPLHLGDIDWTDDGRLSLALDAGSDAKVDGQRATHALLRDDSQPEPTKVEFGSVNFIAIRRGDRVGLRVRDSEAATRTGFTGIECFPVDPAWRVVAEWQPLDPPYALETGTVIGTVESHPAPGRAVFEHDGRRHAVYPVLEAPDDRQLFLIFADRTSGKETHGAARFLYADMPTAGTIVLDFNKAYNPPCAFTPYATCPLAPRENRLDLKVVAGEKKYREKQ